MNVDVIQLGCMSNPYKSPAALDTHNVSHCPRIVDWLTWSLPILFAVLVIVATAILQSSAPSVASMNYNHWEVATELQKTCFIGTGVIVLLSPFVILFSTLLQLLRSDRHISIRIGFLTLTAALWLLAWSAFWLLGIPIIDYVAD